MDGNEEGGAAANGLSELNLYIAEYKYMYMYVSVCLLEKTGFKLTLQMQA